eukprot:PhM_4_TR16380/c1_g1_i1/m.102960
MFSRSIVRAMDLKGKCVVVTGGASGLGEAVCRHFQSLGSNVVVLDLNDEKGAQLTQALGDSAIYHRTDVTSAEDVSAALDAAIAKFQRIDGVVNCAGIAPPAKVLGKKGPHDPVLFQKVLGINAFGSFNVSRLAAERMAKNGDNDENGVIVSTASIAAFDGQIGQAAYAASKGAIVSMTLPMARELAGQKIRVMTVAPGIMATPMMAGLPKAAQDQLSATVPFPKRLGDPVEYARLVQHIFENQYLNGEVIRMDGSLRMS